MASDQVTEKSRTAAREYIDGDPEAAREQLGELAFETLEELFPEASQRRTRARAGPGFLAGVVVGIALGLVASRRLRRR